MDEPISKQLIRLVQNTQKILTLYDDKTQWQHLYPLVAQTAQHYRILYQLQPHALQARLSLYIGQYDFATNLVINQCVLSTALCVSQGYDNELTESYISIALTEHCCVVAQHNKMAQQQILTLSDKKIWRFRHQLAAKMLLSAKHPAHNSVRMLAKLNKYKHALLSASDIMLYDNAITLCALSNIIAMNITYTSKKNPLGFYKALSQLYIKTNNSFAQKLIKGLVAHIGPHLPGSKTVYCEQAMVYLASDKANKHILINANNENKLAWYKVKTRLNDQPLQWLCTDKRVLFLAWNNEHLVANKTKPINSKAELIALVSHIKVAHEYSFKGLDKLLAPFSEITHKLCQAVRPYNNQHQAAKDLRHSLSMVGYDNAPAIIQRVIFEQLVDTSDHPHKHIVLNKLNSLNRILALMVSNNPKQQFEHIALPIYGYVHYLLTYCSSQLSPKVPINSAPNQTYSVPLATFFGVETIDKEHLNTELTQLLSDNPWTKALLDAEQQPKKELNEQHKLWISLKVIAQSVFKPDLPLTPWQQQTLNAQLKAQGFKSQDDFFAQLQGLSLYNSI
ncbi:hypothetical protein [uncultured Pseudoalteromonas sp.]|uniref:hypothetical protein n=1 Tax=uncultured Pseudoalteromonas sp. TaxID=114053 RepID=UPI0030C833E0